MGVRELRIADATPGELYEVTIPERGRPLFWRTLPSRLPDAGLSFLIGSCFWINDDRDGFYASAVQELVQRERLAFKVLMGDQIYVDVWAPKPLKDLRKGLAQKYERYWGDAAYQELLAACPNFVSCDDHEFWNDFPEPQMHVPYSWQRYAPDNGVALRGALRRLPGRAEPRRPALGVVRASRRCRSSSPTRARTARATATPNACADARGAVAATSRRGRTSSTARACSCSRSRC